MSQSSPQPERPSQCRPRDRWPDLPRDRPVTDPREPASDGIRASDAEREAVVERLRIASIEGRLTFEELTERSEAAYAAVTRGELEDITADLPGLGAPGANPAPRQDRRRFSAVMGDCKERIVGRIDGPLEAMAIMGDVVLDLRGAQVPTGEISISATAVMGDVKIIVPDGVSVELSGHAFLGDRRVGVREPRPGAPVPVVRVTAHAVMGDVKIVDDEHHAPLRRAIASWWRQKK